MSTQHTPGPWEGGTSWGVTFIKNIDGKFVLFLTVEDGVKKADLQLMAAAPELLEALIVAQQEAISWYAESRGFDPETDKHPDWLVQSDAAIAKATKE